MVVGRLALALVWAAGCAKARTSAPGDESLPAAHPLVERSGTDGEGAAAGAEVAPVLVLGLQEIEDNLLAIDFVVRFDLEAKGAVQARMIGELVVRERALKLSARGSFGGNPVELSLVADGQRLRGSNGTAKLDLPQPPALREAVVIGLTRMGILHNLARLVAARPPEHADGGVEAWVRTGEVQAIATVNPDGLTPEARRGSPQPMSFAIIVADQPAGEATLWCDPGEDVPVERHQIVQFGDAQMHVRETYAFQLLRRKG